MKKHVAQGLAILLALTLLLASCVGCSKDKVSSDPTDSSGISQSTSDTPGNASDPQSSGADGDHSGTSGGQSDTGKNTTTKNNSSGS